MLKLDTLSSKTYRFPMPLFTSETAAIAGHKGAIARWAKPIAETPPANPEPIPVIMANSDQEFTVRKLARIRSQIDAVEMLLAKATEPQAVDRFCNALTRLYDVERILAGRPLPGSRRPREDRARVSAGWIELQPALPSAPGVQVAPARPIGSEYDDPPGYVREPVNGPSPPKID